MSPTIALKSGTRHLQPLEHLACLVGHLTALQEAQRAWQPRRPCELSAGVEIVGRPQVVEEREILIDRLDAQRPRVGGRADRDRCAVHLDSPLSKRCTPFRHLISVDLPAPLSPSSASTSPLRTWRSMSSSAETAPKRLRAPRTVNAGALSPRAPVRRPSALMRASWPERRARGPRCGRAARRPRRRSARSRRSPSAGRRGRRCGG